MALTFIHSVEVFLTDFLQFVWKYENRFSIRFKCSFCFWIGFGFKIDFVWWLFGHGNTKSVTKCSTQWKFRHSNFGAIDDDVLIHFFDVIWENQNKKKIMRIKEISVLILSSKKFHASIAHQNDNKKNYHFDGNRIDACVSFFLSHSLFSVSTWNKKQRKTKEEPKKKEKKRRTSNKEMGVRKKNCVVEMWICVWLLDFCFALFPQKKKERKKIV